MAQSCRKGCHTWSIESTHVGNFQCNLCPKHGKLLLLRCRMLLRRNSSDFGFGTGIAADSELSCSSNFSWILLHHTRERIFSSTWQQYTNIEKLYQALPSAKLDPFWSILFRGPMCEKPSKTSTTLVLRLQETLEIVQVELVHFTPPGAVPKSNHQHEQYMGCKITVQTSAPKMLGFWISGFYRQHIYIHKSNHHNLLIYSGQLTTTSLPRRFWSIGTGEVCASSEGKGLSGLRALAWLQTSTNRGSPIRFAEKTVGSCWFSSEKRQILTKKQAWLRNNQPAKHLEIFRSESDAFQEGIAVGNGDVLLSEAGQGYSRARRSEGGFNGCNKSKYSHKNGWVNSSNWQTSRVCVLNVEYLWTYIPNATRYKQPTGNTIDLFGALPTLMPWPTTPILSTRRTTGNQTWHWKINHL